MPESSETRCARPMLLADTHVIIDYFHSASPEFLNTLGVDPSRLLERTQWQAIFERLFAQELPHEQGASYARRHMKAPEQLSLSRDSINIVAIAQGSSELNISFVVAAADVAG